MKPIAIEKREVKQKWTDILLDVSDGRISDYDSIKSKDVFEFFALLKSYRSRIKKLNAKNNT